MQRGIIKLSNLELKNLSEFLLLNSGNENLDLVVNDKTHKNFENLSGLQKSVLNKFSPDLKKADEEIITIETSQEELETILDMMPVVQNDNERKRLAYGIKKKLSLTSK